MAIPELIDGLLPPGIHETTLVEIEARFGRFHGNEIRVRLFAKLKEYVSELSSSGKAMALLIDGSFVSAKSDPGDIDIILIMRSDFEAAAEILPSEYNVIDKHRIKRNYGFDVFPIIDGMPAKIVEYFASDSRRPGIIKGMLRLTV